VDGGPGGGSDGGGDVTTEGAGEGPGEGGADPEEGRRRRPPGARGLLLAVASAVAAALIIAAALGWGAGALLRLEPRGGFWLLEPCELWLLAVFSGGMVAILVGLSVAFGGWFRGRSGKGGEEMASNRSIDPAWWTMATGAALLAIYAAAWLWMRG